MRAQLAKAGVTPDAADRILEAHGDDERKQVMRQEAAAEFCVVAVAGARRGDMDELYDFIRSDTDAFKLEPRWGAGWFLVAGNPQSSKGVRN